MRGLAIDPGGSTGWAVYDNGALLDCGACAYDAVPWCQGVDHIAAELPQAYPHETVNPNDLVTLAYRLGVVVGPYVRQGVKVHLVLPREWKGGNIPKSVHQPRIVAKLTEPSLGVYLRALKPLGTKARTDLTDAVGIGQWALRMGLWR